MRFICVSAAVCFLLATTAACDQSRPENEPLTAALTATPFPDLSSPTELAPTPESSETSTPLPTSTSTPLPTETNTPAPTITPVPTSTDTPKPTQTPTPVLILEQVNEDGFAEPANWTIMSFEEFDGNLYAGTRNHETGCEIWRYDGAQWELLVEDGFGDEHNAAVTSMIVFQDMLSGDHQMAQTGNRS
jgi:hypothetical protein